MEGFSKWFKRYGDVNLCIINRIILHSGVVELHQEGSAMTGLPRLVPIVGPFVETYLSDNPLIGVGEKCSVCSVVCAALCYL